jgi:hypothetical protein
LTFSGSLKTPKIVKETAHLTGREALYIGLLGEVKNNPPFKRRSYA